MRLAASRRMQYDGQFWRLSPFTKTVVHNKKYKRKAWQEAGKAVANNKGKA